MHTAICAFDDRARADQAVDLLLRAGFARHDVHVEHRPIAAEGRQETPRAATEPGEPGDRGVLSSFGHFFASLLGRDNPSGHADTYTRHVERGSYVVVVDADDAAQAQRARTLLHEMQGRELNVIERQDRLRLRDIVRRRDAPEPYDSWSGSEALARERAMASHRLEAIGGPALLDPDRSHKDKPKG